MTKPKLIQTQPGVVACHHDTLGKYFFTADSGQGGQTPQMIFTENETNFKVNLSKKRKNKNKSGGDTKHYFQHR